ncbi:MAG: raiA, partial [Myxococcales bacterium]|nr:raiA [Myxococcales bacterium]
KYFNKDPISAHAVFSVERGFNHVADLQITLPNGILINAKEVTEDMYSSIDLAAARIERQVRKWKEKIRDHKPHGGPGAEFRERVISADEIEPRRELQTETSATSPSAAKASPGFRVIKDETFSARSMNVEDAAMQLNLLGDDLLVFTDAATSCISVLYRRKDGNYGLVETGRAGSPSS